MTDNEAGELSEDDEDRSCGGNAATSDASIFHWCSKTWSKAEVSAFFKAFWAGEMEAVPEELLCLNHCLGCIHEYHQDRKTVVESGGSKQVEVVLFTFECSLLSHFLTCLKHRLAIRKQQKKLSTDEQSPNRGHHLPIVLRHILKYPFFLFLEDLHDLFVEVLVECLSEDKSITVSQLPGIYLLLIHPNKKLHTWAKEALREFSPIQLGDSSDLLRVVNLILSVLKFDLQSDPILCDRLGLDEPSRRIIVMSHIFSMNVYWQGLHTLLNHMDVALVGNVHSEIPLTILNSLLQAAKSSTPECDFFLQKLLCFSVLLKSFREEIWFRVARSQEDVFVKIIKCKIWSGLIEKMGRVLHARSSLSEHFGWIEHWAGSLIGQPENKEFQIRHCSVYIYHVLHLVRHQLAHLVPSSGARQCRGPSECTFHIDERGLNQMKFMDAEKQHIKGVVNLKNLCKIWMHLQASVGPEAKRTSLSPSLKLGLAGFVPYEDVVCMVSQRYLSDVLCASNREGPAEMLPPGKRPSQGSSSLPKPASRNRLVVAGTKHRSKNGGVPPVRHEKGNGDEYRRSQNSPARKDSWNRSYDKDELRASDAHRKCQNPAGRRDSGKNETRDGDGYRKCQNPPGRRDSEKNETRGSDAHMKGQYLPGRRDDDKDRGKGLKHPGVKRLKSVPTQSQSSEIHPVSSVSSAQKRSLPRTFEEAFQDSVERERTPDSPSRQDEGMETAVIPSAQKSARLGVVTGGEGFNVRQGAGVQGQAAEPIGRLDGGLSKPPGNRSEILYVPDEKDKDSSRKFAKKSTSRAGANTAAAGGEHLVVRSDGVAQEGDEKLSRRFAKGSTSRAGANTTTAPASTASGGEEETGAGSSSRLLQVLQIDRGKRKFPSYGRKQGSQSVPQKETVTENVPSGSHISGPSREGGLDSSVGGGDEGVEKFRRLGTTVLLDSYGRPHPKDVMGLNIRECLVSLKQISFTPEATMETEPGEQEQELAPPRRKMRRFAYYSDSSDQEETDYSFTLSQRSNDHSLSSIPKASGGGLTNKGLNEKRDSSVPSEQAGMQKEGCVVSLVESSGDEAAVVPTTSESEMEPPDITEGSNDKEDDPESDKGLSSEPPPLVPVEKNVVETTEGGDSVSVAENDRNEEAEEVDAEDDSEGNEGGLAEDAKPAEPADAELEGGEDGESSDDNILEVGVIKKEILSFVVSSDEEGEGNHGETKEPEKETPAKFSKAIEQRIAQLLSPPLQSEERNTETIGMASQSVSNGGRANMSEVLPQAIEHQEDTAPESRPVSRQEVSSQVIERRKDDVPTQGSDQGEGDEGRMDFTEEEIEETERQLSGIDDGWVVEKVRVVMDAERQGSVSSESDNDNEYDSMCQERVAIEADEGQREEDFGDDDDDEDFLDFLGEGDPWWSKSAPVEDEGHNSDGLDLSEIMDRTERIAGSGSSAQMGGKTGNPAEKQPTFARMKSVPVGSGAKLKARHSTIAPTSEQTDIPIGDDTRETGPKNEETGTENERVTRKICEADEQRNDQIGKEGKSAGEKDRQAEGHIENGGKDLGVGDKDMKEHFLLNLFEIGSLVEDEDESSEAGGGWMTGVDEDNEKVVTIAGVEELDVDEGWVSSEVADGEEEYDEEGWACSQGTSLLDNEISVEEQRHKVQTTHVTGDSKENEEEQSRGISLTEEDVFVEERRHKVPTGHVAAGKSKKSDASKAGKDSSKNFSKGGWLTDSYDDSPTGPKSFQSKSFYEARLLKKKSSQKNPVHAERPHGYITGRSAQQKRIQRRWSVHQEISKNAVQLGRQFLVTGQKSRTQEPATIQTEEQPMAEAEGTEDGRLAPTVKSSGYRSGRSKALIQSLREAEGQKDGNVRNFYRNRRPQQPSKLPLKNMRKDDHTSSMSDETAAKDHVPASADPRKHVRFIVPAQQPLKPIVRTSHFAERMDPSLISVGGSRDSETTKGPASNRPSKSLSSWATASTNIPNTTARESVPPLRNSDVLAGILKASSKTQKDLHQRRQRPILKTLSEEGKRTPSTPSSSSSKAVQSHPANEQPGHTANNRERVDPSGPSSSSKSTARISGKGGRDNCSKAVQSHPANKQPGRTADNGEKDNPREPSGSIKVATMRISGKDGRDNTLSTAHSVLDSVRPLDAQGSSSNQQPDPTGTDSTTPMPETSRGGSARQHGSPEKRPARIYPSKPLMVDQFLGWILSWTVNHMTEKVSRDPAKILEGCDYKTIHEVTNSFSSIDLYYETFLPLKMVQIWNDVRSIYKRSENETRISTAVLSESAPRKYKGKMYRRCCFKISFPTPSPEEPPPPPDKYPRECDLIVIKPDKTDAFEPIFGYVEGIVVSTAAGFSWNRKSSVLSVRVRILGDTDLSHCVQLLPLTSLDSYIEQFRAFCMLPKSRVLTPSILNPIRRDVFSMEDVRPLDSSIYKENHNTKEQENFIRGAFHCIQSYGVPRICMLQGPPCSGKTRTLTSLVACLLRHSAQVRAPLSSVKPKVLLCAPNETALDAIHAALWKTIRRDRTQTNTRANTPGELPFFVLRLGEVRHVTSKYQHFVLGKIVSDKQAKCDNNIKALKTKVGKLEMHVQSLDSMIQYNSSSNHDLVGKLRSERTHFQHERRDVEEQLEREVKWKKNFNEEATSADVLAQAEVICCKLNDISSPELQMALRRPTHDPLKVTFSCAIIDEACQCLEVDTILPLYSTITKLVMAGDPHELKHKTIPQISRRYKLTQSLFTRLWMSFQRSSRRPVQMLTEQHVCHPEIFSFPNRTFYNNRINRIYNTSAQEKEADEFVMSPYLVFNLLDSQEVETPDGDYSNEAEADLVQGIMGCIEQQKFSSIAVAIVSPYPEQINLLKQRFGSPPGLYIGDIEGLQGKNKDIVIMSCVRTEASKKNLGFLDDHNKLNVALTRASFSMFIIGNFDALPAINTLWSNLLEDARHRELYTKIENVKTRQQVQRPLLQNCIKENLRSYNRLRRERGITPNT